MQLSLKTLGVAPILTALAVWPMLIYYYLGGARILAFLAYVICLIIYLSRVHLRHKNNIVLLSISIVLLLEFAVGLFTFGDLLSHVFSYRLIYGFMILALGFSFVERIQIERVFLLLAILTIFEKFALIVHPSLIFTLPNYDGGVTFSYENAANILGGVHSFGGNRTVSGVILLAGFIYALDKEISWVAKVCILFASVLCVSGTAMILTAMYLMSLAIVRLFSSGLMRKMWIFFVLLFALVLLVPVFFATSYEDATLDRFSLYYLNFIFEYKIDQINDYAKSSDLFSFVFGLGASAFTSGSEELAGYGSRYGDFIALDFFSRYGLLGSITFLCLIGLAIRREVVVPITVLLIGTLHYHVLFSGPGQVMSALLLAKGLHARKKVFSRPCKTPATRMNACDVG